LAEAILDTSLEKGKDQAGKQYKKEKRREIADHVTWRPTRSASDWLIALHRRGQEYPQANIT
tara:strand:+ start:10771 stop:10956 length:186 start_codon:yes stop_codon:yes gene_type:complete